MKKFLIIGVLIFSFQSIVTAQSAHHLDFDIGLNQNYKGFFKNYNGVLEIGGSYSLGITRDLFAGISMHTGFLNRKNSPAHSVFYKPALMMSYTIHLSDRFACVPLVSAGYTWFSLYNDEYNYKDIQSGVNTGAGVRVIWKTQERTNFYIFGRYNFIYLDEDKSFTELFYYRKIHQTAFGLGISIK